MKFLTFSRCQCTSSGNGSGEMCYCLLYYTKQYFLLNDRKFFFFKCISVQVEGYTQHKHFKIQNAPCLHVVYLSLTSPWWRHSITTVFSSSHTYLTQRHPSSRVFIARHRHVHNPVHRQSSSMKLELRLQSWGLAVLLVLVLRLPPGKTTDRRLEIEKQLLQTACSNT